MKNSLKAPSHLRPDTQAWWQSVAGGLLAFWRSGKYTTTDTLAEFGLNVRIPPWIFVRGSRNTLPWAAKVFDRDGLARRAQRRREAAGEGRQRS